MRNTRQTKEKTVLLSTATVIQIQQDLQELSYGDVPMQIAQQDAKLTDLMVLEGRIDHSHDHEDDRTYQRPKLRQAYKRKASEDLKKRPQKLIIAETGKTENENLIPDDISAGKYHIRKL